MYTGAEFVGEEESDSPSAVSSSTRSSTNTDDSDLGTFEWDLSKPADILTVFLIMRNIDDWTSTVFKERVEHGVRALADAVANRGDAYRPWRVEDTALQTKKSRPTRSKRSDENDPTPQASVTTTTTTTTTRSRSSLSLSYTQVKCEKHRFR
jgi:hypothetical protein